MAFLLKNSIISSPFRSHSPSEHTENGPLSNSRRGFHVEPGSREKLLLAEHPALKPFKSHKKKVRIVKRVGDVLTIVVVAGCCYEIYVKATMREAARREAGESAERSM